MEEALVRNLVLTFEAREDALVSGRVSTTAVLRWPADPAEAGIELLATPCFRFLEHDELLFARALFENVDLVGTFAPDEGLFCFLALEIGVEKRRRSRCEILG